MILKMSSSLNLPLYFTCIIGIKPLKISHFES
jgi:hypothetical protein